MTTIIGFSTGAVHSWDASINKQIEILREVDADAIEINYAKALDLHERITEENICYLRSRGFVSIHAPFFDDKREDLIYDDRPMIRTLLDMLDAITISINAQAVVFHPNLIADYSLFEHVRFNACLENMSRKRNIDLQSFADIIKTHTRFNVVLDTAHVLSWQKETIKEHISLFGERISHVHLSDYRYCTTKKKKREHKQMLSCSDLGKFEALKTIRCPIILEPSIKDKKDDLKNLEEEYDLVKRFFSCM